MKRLSILFTLCFCFAAVGCGEPADEPTDTPETLSKDEARSMAGKGDHRDWCDIFGWYGDGICDDFCANPDPDCVETCTSDADCPDGFCEHFATCAAIGCPPPPPSQCVVADCDDGSSLNPLCDIREVCAEGEVSAVINGCFECVDARTCEGSTPDDPTGQMCGGIAGLLCPDGFRCAMPDGMCNVADGAGTCVPDADVCPAVFDPVCGCDGNTYSNSCAAGVAGVAVDHDGECPDSSGQACGSRGMPPCAADQYCAFEESAMCGATDIPGTCTTRPEVCITLFDPVCGCDGNTYSNSCFAASAGVSVASEGSCD